MSLIKCVECGWKVDEQAAVCPFCGGPIEKAAPNMKLYGPEPREVKKVNYWRKGIGALFIIAGIGLSLSGMPVLVSWGTLFAGFAVFLTSLKKK